MKNQNVGIVGAVVGIALSIGVLYVMAWTVGKGWTKGTENK
jgi:hypothetical protein